MSIFEEAIEELDRAEMTIMSFVARTSDFPEDGSDEDFPDAVPMLLAVLRSVSRVAGMLKAIKEVDDEA